MLQEEGPGNNPADGIANVDDDDPDNQQNSDNNDGDGEDHADGDVKEHVVLEHNLRRRRQRKHSPVNSDPTTTSYCF